MDANNLSAMEIDAIGEILNISLGASATAVSTMLDARVDITTPIVNVRNRDEFEFSSIEPAIGVEITYVEGLDGSNIMLLKRNDVKMIVEMLMGMEIPDEEFELNEMNISAICEVMNQMMGASATALSELLSKTVNISTPVSFEIESSEQFKDKYFKEEGRMVAIGFTLSISDKLHSEFLNLMPIRLAKELVSGFFPDGFGDEEPAAPPQMPAEPVKEEPIAPPGMDTSPGAAMSQEEIERMLQNMSGSAEEESQPAQSAAPQPETASVPPQPSAGGGAAQPAMGSTVQPQQTAGVPVQTYVQPAMDPAVLNNMMQMMDMMRQSLEMQQQQIRESAPKKIRVNPAPQPNLNEGKTKGDTSEDNLDLMMDVPMEVSVEIGRTRKMVRDILDLNKGSLVVLDKLAGEQVDLFVNGQCIAKGDVVVVDDNFGIRITEIL